MSALPGPARIGMVLGMPGAVRTYTVERLVEASASGRASQDWTVAATVSGVLGRSTADDLAMAEQPQDRASHVLLVPGPRSAVNLAPGDRLNVGDVYYWVVAVLDPAGLGLYTRVLLDERAGPVEAV